MLAGNMKLKTFLGLVGLGGVVLVGAGGWWWSTRPAPAPEPLTPAFAPTPPPPDGPISSPPPTSTAAQAALPTAEGAALPHQADVLTWVGKDLGSDKRKDTTKGRAWKVNVYQDAGQATANRAKVDLDRDDKWDEKWTFEADGRVSRQVAPADDEQYSESWVWNGQDWQRGG